MSKRRLLRTFNNSLTNHPDAAVVRGEDVDAVVLVRDATGVSSHPGSQRFNSIRRPSGLIAHRVVELAVLPPRNGESSCSTLGRFTTHVTRDGLGRSPAVVCASGCHGGLQDVTGSFPVRSLHLVCRRNTRLSRISSGPCARTTSAFSIAGPLLSSSVPSDNRSKTSAVGVGGGVHRMD